MERLPDTSLSNSSVPFLNLTCNHDYSTLICPFYLNPCTFLRCHTNTLSRHYQKSVSFLKNQVRENSYCEYYLMNSNSHQREDLAAQPMFNNSTDSKSAFIEENSVFHDKCCQSPHQPWTFLFFFFKVCIYLFI